MTPTIHTVVASPEPLVLAGCRSFLGLHREIEIVAECTTFTGALRALKRFGPRILIIDAQLCGGDLAAASRRLRRASGRTAIACLCRSDGLVRVGPFETALDAIVPSAVTSEQLCACVEALAAGKAWHPSVRVGRGRASDSQPYPPRRSPLGLLTLRERQIVQGVASGQRNREIAQALGIRPGTVKLHLHRIYRKLGVNSRLALFRKLVREAQPRN